MKILVTGGNGFLGGEIVRQLLARGDEVISVQRSPTHEFQPQSGAVYLRGDIAKYDSIVDHFKGVDAVIHVAAKAGYWGSWNSYFQPNVLGTENVINACREQGIKTLVYTSTPSVVFTGKAISGQDESMPYGEKWLCHYAHTKRIAEEKALKADIHSVALRPHLIWGAGDNHLIPRLLARARSGKLRIVGDGQNRVDITHVFNAARAHLLALDKLITEPETINGKAYFLSQGEPVVLWEWINDLLQRVDIKPVTRKVSAQTAYKVGSIFEFFYNLLRLRGEPRMTRFVATELAKDHFFDISAVKRDLSYEAVVGNEDGMRALVKWIKSS